MKTHLKGWPMLLIALLMAMSSCGETSKTTRLKLAHGLDTKHSVHKGMV